MLNAVKNFFITFLIAAVVFGVAAYYISIFLTETVTPVLAPDDGLDEILSHSTDTAESTSETEEELVAVPVTDEEGNAVTDESGNAVTEMIPADEVVIEELPAGESLNFLLIATNYRPDDFSDYLPDINNAEHFESLKYGALSKEYRSPEAVSILLFRLDRERRQYTATSFPHNTRIYVNGVYMTLGESCYRFGAKFVAEKINAMTGVQVDRYAALNVTEFPALLAFLADPVPEPVDGQDPNQEPAADDAAIEDADGEEKEEPVIDTGIEIVLDSAIYYANGAYTTLPPDPETVVVEDGKEDETINVSEEFLKAGKHTITTKNITALICLDDTVNSEKSIRTKLQQQIADAIIRYIGENFTEEAYTKLSELLIQLGETDFTAEDLLSRMELAAALEELEALTLTYPGSYSQIDGKTVYNADIPGGLTYFSEYRRLHEAPLS